MSRQIASPSPVPWPGGLVLKKGSKTRDRNAGAHVTSRFVEEFLSAGTHTNEAVDANHQNRRDHEHEDQTKPESHRLRGRRWWLGR
jgi:hypothetical protein